MPELVFQVRGAEAAGSAAAPTIALYLEITGTPQEQTIQTVVLNCQIQIEAARRSYAGAAAPALDQSYNHGSRLHWFDRH